MSRLDEVNFDEFDFDSPDDPVGNQENEVMDEDNQISVVIDAAAKSGFIGKVGEARALLTFLRNIPADKKGRYSGIAKARAGLDDVCVRLMQAHPELVPSWIVMAEVLKDVVFRKDMKDMILSLMELVETMQDTSLLSSSDSMKAYRAFYESVKSAAKHNVAGADTMVAQIAPFFANSGPSTPETPPNPAK